MSSFLMRRSVAVARPAAAATRAFTTTPARPMARMTLVGNLAATPELHATSTGKEMVRYSVASNSGPRDNRQTSWFRVASFQPEGPGRDYLLSLPKGTLVYVEGDATMGTYEDAEGNTRSSLNIFQQKIEVLRRGREEADQITETGQPPQ